MKTDRKEQGLKKTVEELTQGLWVGDIRLFTPETGKGRFQGEVNLSIHVEIDHQKELLLLAKIFYGTRAFYTSWVELSEIAPYFGMKNKTIPYFDSKLEDQLLSLFSKNLGPADKIYVEYNNDDETLYGLSHNFPPVVTRLGYKLFKLGFTWFKDWYFPEGWSEGGQKLQGERPLDRAAEERHIQRIKHRITSFLEKKKKEADYESKARSRGQNILNTENDKGDTV